VIVGAFHVAAYVFIRGKAGARLPLLIIGAVLGAWAGDTVAGRMDIDPLRVGDFHLLTASFVAWLAIGLVAILAILVPERKTAADAGPLTQRVRRSAAPAADTEPQPEAPTT